MKCKIPNVPEFSIYNCQIFYLVCQNSKERDELIYYLKRNGTQSTFYFLSLHKSEFFKDKYKGCDLPNAEYLIKLPVCPNPVTSNKEHIIEKINKIYN